MRVLLKSLLAASILAQASCVTKSPKELSSQGMEDYSDSISFCTGYFKMMFSPESESLKKIKTTQELSNWQSHNSASRLSNLIAAIRRASLNNKFDSDLDKKYEQMNLLLLDNFPESNGYSDERCGVLSLNLFREHLYQSLGGKNSEVIKEMRKTGTKDRLKQDKLLLVALGGSPD